MTHDPSKPNLNPATQTETQTAATTPSAQALTNKPVPAPAQAIAKKGVVSLPGLHARLRKVSQSAALDPTTRANRIALLLDASGSMQGTKNKALQDACSSFIQQCDFTTTALAIECFGADIRVPLTCMMPLLLTTAMTIPASGCTPLAEAMEYTLNNISITRAVVVSDGQPDSEDACFAIAEQAKAADLPYDCVHIGDSASGEACLQRIAEITSGVFIKFKDVASFAKSFKYLTPSLYAMLTSGGVSAAQLGATEIK